jgi:hypothetical protein
MIREDWINYFNNPSLFVMFTNQLILIHLTKGMFREFSVQKSVHSRYTTSGIPFAVKKQKPSNILFQGFLRGPRWTRTTDPLIMSKLNFFETYTNKFSAILRHINNR